MLFSRVVKKELDDCVIDEADCATAALEKVAEGDAYDLIVIDVLMPETDGVSLCAKLLDEGVKLDTLVLVTSSAYELEREEVTKLNIRGLLKPFSPGRVKEILGDLATG